MHEIIMLDGGSSINGCIVRLFHAKSITCLHFLEVLL